MALHAAGGLELHDPRGPFQPKSFHDSMILSARAFFPTLDKTDPFTVVDEVIIAHVLSEKKQISLGQQIICHYVIFNCQL